MARRCMYVWKLGPVLDAEGGVENLVAKATRAQLSALWVKVADGQTVYSNATGRMGRPCPARRRKAKSLYRYQCSPHYPT
jgi:hypothetical protein